MATNCENKKGLKKSKSDSHQEGSDVVAYWSVPLVDGVYKIELEHGTSSGKRVIRVDGKEILRKEWMFKLVGDERFTIGNKETAKCVLHIDPIPHFSFSYSLFVNGKPLEKFSEKQNEKIRTWTFVNEGTEYRIVFDKQTLNLWINGAQINDTEHEFVENGTELKFLIGQSVGVIRIVTGSNKKDGIITELYIDNTLIAENIL